MIYVAWIAFALAWVATLVAGMVLPVPMAGGIIGLPLMAGAAWGFGIFAVCLPARAEASAARKGVGGWLGFLSGCAFAVIVPFAIGGAFSGPGPQPAETRHFDSALDAFTHVARDLPSMGLWLASIAGIVGGAWLRAGLRPRVLIALALACFAIGPVLILLHSL